MNRVFFDVVVVATLAKRKQNNDVTENHSELNRSFNLAISRFSVRAMCVEWAFSGVSLTNFNGKATPAKFTFTFIEVNQMELDDIKDYVQG
jgi:hypothetical protein